MANFLRFNDILKDAYMRSFTGGTWDSRPEFWPFNPPKTGARRILERWCHCGGKVEVYTSLKKPFHKLCGECLALRVLAGEIKARSEPLPIPKLPTIPMRYSVGRIKLNASLFAKPDRNVDAVPHDEGAAG